MLKILQSSAASNFVKKAKRLYVILFICSCQVLTKAASSTTNKLTEITLADAVKLALRQNPEVLRAREEIYRAQGLIVSRRGPALPQLSLSANLTFDDQYLTRSRFNPQFQAMQRTITLPIGPGGSNVTFPLGGGGATGRRLPTNEQWDVSLTLSKVIFDGFATRANIASAKLERELALAGLEETALQVIYDAQSAFLRALLTRELINVERESITLLEEELANQQRRFDAGTVPRFNVLRAEVELANQRPSLIRAENAHRLALQRLAVVLGMDNPADKSIAPPIFPVGKLAANAPQITLEDALKTARTQRPIVRQLDALERIRDQGLKIAHSQLYPRLTAFLSYSILKEQFSNDWSKTDSGYRAGVGATWDLFDGLAAYGDIAQARSARRLAEINTFDRMRLLDLEVRDAYSRYVEALELVAASEKTVEQAREALRLANTRFDAGAATQLDVLNARVALTQAATVQLTALHDLQTAVAALRRTTTIGYNIRTLVLEADGNQTPSEKKSSSAVDADPKPSKDKASNNTNQPSRAVGNRVR